MIYTKQDIIVIWHAVKRYCVCSFDEWLKTNFLQIDDHFVRI